MLASRMPTGKRWTLLTAGLLLVAGLLPHQWMAKAGGDARMPAWTDGAEAKIGQAVRILVGISADAPGAAHAAAEHGRGLAARPA